MNIKVDSKNTPSQLKEITNNSFGVISINISKCLIPKVGDGVRNVDKKHVQNILSQLKKGNVKLSQDEGIGLIVTKNNVQYETVNGLFEKYQVAVEKDKEKIREQLSEKINSSSDIEIEIHGGTHITLAKQAFVKSCSNSQQVEMFKTHSYVSI
jgi:hypothetical protein